MFRLMTGFRNVQSNGVSSRYRRNFVRVTGLLAFTGVLSLTSAFAKDPEVKEAKSTAKGAVAHSQAQPETAIPECLEKLKLSPQQHEQIKEIIQKYDGSLGLVWKQFGDRYMQTITMESSLLAAIEDNFTDAQRNKVRDLRHKTAHYEKDAAATNEKPNTATTKPASAVDDELAGVGVTLTSDQEASAEKVQEKYRSPLRSLNRDVQGLHTRLLSLEADKLVAIEKVLTKDQLAQLRTHRQNAPDAPKVSIDRTVTKTE